jgi:hypothetical protein
LIFRIIDVTHRQEPSLLSDPLELSTTLDSISRSQYKDDVRGLDVGIIWQHRVDGLSEAAKYVEELASGMSKWLPRLQNLRELKIVNTLQEMHAVSTVFQPLDERFADVIRKLLRQMAIKGLKSLELQCYRTYDVAQLLKDDSGPGSQLSEWTPLALKSLDRLRIQIHLTLHNALTPRRNAAEIAFILQVVQVALPLDTFSMICNAKSERSPVIEMAKVDLSLLKTDNFRRLRCLELSGVTISHLQVVAIVKQNHTTLTTITLHRIELSSGTWADVLLHLCLLPKLQEFKFKQVLYPGPAYSGCQIIWYTWESEYIQAHRWIEGTKNAESIHVHVKDSEVKHNLNWIIRSPNRIDGAVDIHLYRHLKHLDPEVRKDLATFYETALDVPDLNPTVKPELAASLQLAEETKVSRDCPH